VSEATDTRRPGRPRSPEAHAAILRAALELTAESGLRGLSMEAIAARAGVGKATIYRRWKTKEALFADALRTIAVAPDIPDTGTVRGDIEEASGDPELLKALDTALLGPRRATIGAILRRGVARGELREDLDVDLVTDMLMGPLVARLLMSGGDGRALVGLPMRVFDTLVAGIGTGRRVG
jgi:AcrR family transcriptional regulator